MDIDKTSVCLMVMQKRLVSNLTEDKDMKNLHAIKILLDQQKQSSIENPSIKNTAFLQKLWCKHKNRAGLAGHEIIILNNF